MVSWARVVANTRAIAAAAGGARRVSRVALLSSRSASIQEVNASIFHNRYTKTPTTTTGPSKAAPIYPPVDAVVLLELLEKNHEKRVIDRKLRKMLDSSVISSSGWTHEDVGLLTSALLKEERERDVLELVKNSTRPSASQDVDARRQVINNAIAECARSGHANLALQLLELSIKRKVTPDVNTYTSVIMACASDSIDMLERAVDEYEEAISAGISPGNEMHTALLLVYARLDNWDGIQQLLQHVAPESEEDQAKFLASVIAPAMHARQFRVAYRLFNAVMDNGVAPGDEVCLLALKACIENGETEGIRNVLQLLQQEATPDAITYNTIVAGYSRIGDLDRALETCEMMKENGVEPSIWTYNALLAGVTRWGSKVQVYEVLERMQEKSPSVRWDLVTLNLLLEGCARWEDPATAEALWNDERSKQIARDSVHFESFLQVYFRSGQYSKIIDFWHSSVKCRERARTEPVVNTLMQSCRELALADMAKSIMSDWEATSKVTSSTSYNHLLETYLAAADFESARTILEKMTGHRRIKPTIFSYTLLMKYALSNGQPDEALSIFYLFLNDIGQDESRKYTVLQKPVDAIYLLALRAAVAANAHEEVLNIFSLSPQETPKTMRTEYLSAVIESCKIHGDWETAVTQFDKASDTLTPEGKVRMYEMVVTVVGIAGAVEQALEINGGGWYRDYRHDNGWF